GQIEDALLVNALAGVDLEGEQAHAQPVFTTHPAQPPCQVHLAPSAKVLAELLPVAAVNLPAEIGNLFRIVIIDRGDQGAWKTAEDGASLIVDQRRPQSQFLDPGRQDRLHAGPFHAGSREKLGEQSRAVEPLAVALGFLNLAGVVGAAGVLAPADEIPRGPDTEIVRSLRAPADPLTLPRDEQRQQWLAVVDPLVDDQRDVAAAD